MQSLGEMIVKQVDAVGDFLLEALVSFGERVGGAVVAGIQGLKDAGSRTMAAVKNAGENFSAFAGKSSAPETQVARSQQIETSLPTPAIPEQAQSAVAGLGMKNCQIVASQMVDMPSGTCVAPTAVAFGGQQQGHFLS